MNTVHEIEVHIFAVKIVVLTRHMVKESLDLLHRCTWLASGTASVFPVFRSSSGIFERKKVFLGNERGINKNHEKSFESSRAPAVGRTANASLPRNRAILKTIQETNQV